MKHFKTIHLIRQFILLLIRLLTVNYGYVVSAQDKFDEYMVKAAFTMNFARLTQWPEKRLKASEDINICVMGNETLKSTFSLVNGKNINGNNCPAEYYIQAEHDQTMSYPVYQWHKTKQYATNL